MTVFNSPTRFLMVCVRSFTFFSIQLLTWIILFGAIIASSWSLNCWLYSNTRSTCKCDIVKYYYNCLITITCSSCYLFIYFNAWHFYTTKYRNTLHSHYFVVLGAQFWTTGCFERLANCQCILHRTIILSSE